MSSTNSMTKEDALVLGGAATIPVAAAAYSGHLQSAMAGVSNSVGNILGSGLSLGTSILPGAIGAGVGYLAGSKKFGNLGGVAGTGTGIATFGALSNTAASGLMIDGGLTGLAYGIGNKFGGKAGGIATAATTLGTIGAGTLQAVGAGTAAPWLAIGGLTALSYYGGKKLTGGSKYGGLALSALVGGTMSGVAVPALAGVAALYGTNKLLIPGIKKTGTWLRDRAGAINPFKGGAEQ